MLYRVCSLISNSVFTNVPDDITVVPSLLRFSSSGSVGQRFLAHSCPTPTFSSSRFTPSSVSFSQYCGGSSGCRSVVIVERKTRTFCFVSWKWNIIFTTADVDRFYWFSGVKSVRVSWTKVTKPPPENLLLVSRVARLDDLQQKWYLY